MPRLRKEQGGSPRVVRSKNDVESLVQWFDRLNFGNGPQENLPSAMAKDMFPYQKTGLGWLKRMEESPSKGGILADEPGLGKTAQIIALILETRPQTLEGKPNLVICPVSVLDHWEDELRTWVKPEHRLKVCVYHGSNKPGYEVMKSCDVVLTTYDSLVRNKEISTFTGIDCSWHRVILDEANKILKGAIGTAKAVNNINATFRWCVTGTPPQDTKEFQKLTDFLRICSSNDLGKIMLRRTKAFLKFPPFISYTVGFELTVEERQKYDTLKKEAEESLKGTKRDEKAMCTWYNRLRELCCSKELDEANQHLSVKSSTKAFTIIQILNKIRESNSEAKTVIFSESPNFLDRTAALVDRMEPEWGYEYYDGEMSRSRRHNSLKRFSENSECNIIFISLRAGGKGLHLPKASHIILAEPICDAMTEEQAISRVHCIGQQQQVQVYKLASSNTVEDHTLKLKDEKNQHKPEGGGAAYCNIDMNRENLRVLLNISS